MARPAYCTTLGKVLLAALQTDQLDRYLSRAPLIAMTPKSITDAHALRREFDPEVRCVAVRVRDFIGLVIGALGMSGPVWRLSMQVLQSRAKHVRKAAESLSNAFGAPAAEAHKTS